MVALVVGAVIDGVGEERFPLEVCGEVAVDAEVVKDDAVVSGAAVDAVDYHDGDGERSSEHPVVVAEARAVGAVYKIGFVAASGRNSPAVIVLFAALEFGA